MNSIDTSSVTVSTDISNPNPAYLSLVALTGEVSGRQEAQSTSAEKPAGKHDLYTVSEDGHFIGDDGFVVPRSFEEFFARHPRYVRDKVHQRWPNLSEGEREDRENELLIFLMTLPEKSKFRARGFNGFAQGCQDRIQTFYPDNAYGASKVHFFCYVKMILANRCISLAEKASSEPIRRYNTLSLHSLDPDGVVSDEAYINALSTEGGTFGMVYDHVIENRIFVDAFLRFVKKYNPELLVIIRAIQMTDTFVEAKHALGLPSRHFARARSRLVVLYACFDKGTSPPRQRKVYRCDAPRRHSPNLAPIQRCGPLSLAGERLQGVCRRD